MACAQRGPQAAAPYVAVIGCIQDAGFVGAGGSFFSGTETVDETLEKVGDNYSLTPDQKASVRACANARLAGE